MTRRWRYETNIRLRVGWGLGAVVSGGGWVVATDGDRQLIIEMPKGSAYHAADSESLETLDAKSRVGPSTDGHSDDCP